MQVFAPRSSDTEPSSQSVPFRSSTLDNGLFFALIALFLLPIWLFEYLPTQDGPIHVHTADVLHSFLTDGPSIFQDYYVPNLQLAPNWTTQVILTGLMFIASPAIAEKLLLSLYVILLPLAVRYALNGVRPEVPAPSFLAFLAFPLCYNLTFNMGFYNFAYSLVVFLFTLGYWFRSRNRPSQIGLLMVLSLGLYFTHLFSFIVFCIVVGVLILWQGIRLFLSSRRGHPITLKRFLIKTTLPTGMALLPTCLICLQFLSQNSTGSKGPRWVASVVDNLRLGSLITLSSLVSYSWFELVCAIAIGLVLIGLTVYSLWRRGIPEQGEKIMAGNGLLMVTLVLLGVYLFAPRGLSGSVTIKDRLLLYPILTLMLWLATGRYPSWIRRGMTGLLVSISIALLVIQTTTYGYLNDYWREYTSTAPFIEEHSTLLAINLPSSSLASPQAPDLWRPPKFVRPWQLNPFINVSGHMAVSRKAVLLNNYQANEDYFPVNFRPELNPFEIMAADDWRLLGKKLHVDILGYAVSTGRPIDYVAIWQTADRPLQEQEAIFQQLSTAYELIYTSPQRGYARLYRYKG
ncbi:hypothetical protein IQ260_26720 [Leptolyngbya cf. ectocarpi LEGE 11479]|uniref:Uncharacterized protein n=1 Tax=Leptolyngbya cf. ectocarpi LEGE 11479 TaxID=1828722 RepID=A0A928ZZE3_LEPEC|nr:hypothetical protein [Leptolyngbya ectocarpi]MBE9070240.1 hypothetical protein [Leptolyngbya cf. ectocarpi LEGE 11479]